jgi:hypothetical protein
VSAYAARSSITQQGLPSVGEHHPGDIALPDVEVSCAQPDQPLDVLRLAVPSHEVQVESRRLGLRLCQ